ncbi:hypothetical protein CANCADRAFT_26345 [Tortispora caseinolytica NRRL Y-17796]|uniref:Mitochondrial-processing peptidase subunit alpha n=1 Tax=Tortispora caseinolytica NRRL Y-17796 TaxID=767744 RepID=A0A1E4TGG1_9ASCO|nr:hypothetical protein CANCADRAFT_26345 [Tortispora caseinolytica NRRL Y-17796]
MKRFSRLLNARKYSAKSLSNPTFSLEKLQNGVRVAIDESSSAHFSALGVFVDAGSRYEKPDQGFTGMSHMMDRLAFKGSSKIDAIQMQEQLDSLGGNYMCAAARESIMYQAAVFGPGTDEMFSLLADTIVDPRITQDEIEIQKSTIEYEVSEISLKPELILPEWVHMTAYNNNTLGYPLLCPPDALAEMSVKKALEYRKKFYTSDRIVVGIIGVPKQHALELAEKHFGQMKPASTPVERDPAIYTGGLIHLPATPPIGGLPVFDHLHVGVEGLPAGDPDMYALAVLQTLLGGGGSFSAGGPGKGMYSRMYTHVLNQYGFIESCQSFNHSYSDSGLFGIASSCIPKAAPYMAEVLGRELFLTMSRARGALTEVEVNRAKNQLRSSVLMNLESRMVTLEDLGRQVQVYGTQIGDAEMSDRIQSVTTADVRRVAQRVLQGNASNNSGKPTVVIQSDNPDAFGDVLATLKRYGIGR